MKLSNVKSTSLLKKAAKTVVVSSILATGIFSPYSGIISDKPAEVQAATTYTVNASSLNVRSGPGTKYAKIGSLPRGASISVVTKLSSGWYKISYKGKTGYVSGQYVKIGTTSVTYRVKVGTTLNVRSGPGTKYATLGSLTNGTVLKVIRKETNGWYRISFNGKTGYVSGQYVTTGSVTASKRLNVPLVYQRPELPSGCEATALTMALNYYGVKVGKTTIAKKMPYDSTKLVRNADGSIRIWGDPDVGFVGSPFGNGYTINPGPLKRVLDQYRSGGINLTGKSYSEIEKQVALGRPVLAWFTISHEMPTKRTWKTPKGKIINAARPLHCIVVTGFDSNYVYFNDSESRQKNVKMSKSKFSSIYNAMGKRALAVK
ncbi:SH3 domain-containing protein [Peribacillus sp. SCS-26]|uniref:SH3 domain-containing protein n=1 Tax=Paraperibacillus marinus TaxID=3115295 RepID=UPI0039057E45